MKKIFWKKLKKFSWSFILWIWIHFFSRISGNGKFLFSIFKIFRKCLELKFSVVIIRDWNEIDFSDLPDIPGIFTSRFSFPFLKFVTSRFLFSVLKTEDSISAKVFLFLLLTRSKMKNIFFLIKYLEKIKTKRYKLFSTWNFKKLIHNTTQLLIYLKAISLSIFPVFTLYCFYNIQSIQGKNYFNFLEKFKKKSDIYHWNNQ